MKISMCMPYMERGYDRSTTLEWCRRTDEGPFQSLACGERVTSYTQDMRVILSAAAALTERVRIVPSLYVLPMHSAVRVAKELATLDVLSGGRVTATVGVGGREQDYRALDASFARRLPRLDEGVATMKSIWAGEPPFEGADPVGPTPVQPGGPPLWAGAMMPKAIGRASKWAQGLYGFTMNGDPGPVREQFRLAREAWAESGRDELPYLANGFWFCLAPDGEERLKQYVFDYLKIAGEEVARAVAKTMTCWTPDAVRVVLDRLQEEGCQECFLVPSTEDPDEVDRAAELVASWGGA